MTQAPKIIGATPAPFPDWIAPMTASLCDGPFHAAGWVFEPKLDGIRVSAYIKNGKVTLASRRGLDITSRYPQIVRELSRYKHNMVLDGEIVSFNEKGVPSFQALQRRSGLNLASDISRADSSNPAHYYVFDILYLDKWSVLNAQFTDRKQLLLEAVPSGDSVKIVESISDDGNLAYSAAVDAGLEGVMAKRIDGRYEEGRRSKSWLKIKSTLTEEFIICGYTIGTGARAPTFGSLILGYYNQQGQLVYAGGCGTGFNDKTLVQLKRRFEKLQTPFSPFAKKVPGKRIVWLSPELIAEVKFAEWTMDGILRAPVFMHLREDKRQEECQHNPVVHIDPKGVEQMNSKHSGKQPQRTSRTPKARKDSETSSKRKTRLEVVVEKPVSKAGAAHDAMQSEVLEQLSGSDEKLMLKVGSEIISVTNLNKVFWPATDESPALTKRDYMTYLARVSPWLLNHMRDRPITFLRFPNGITGGKFYQKHWEKGLPPFAETLFLFSEQYREDQEYIVCNNMATLLWLAQIADLELHTWQARIQSGPDAQGLSRTFTGSVAQLEASLLNYPDYLVFDLDPYLYSGKEKSGDEPELHHEGFKRTVELALWVKEILDTLKIEAFIKTTGKTGLHLYVPIVRNLNFDEVRALSGAVGKAIVQRHPNQVTMEWAVIKRTGKVFLDHNMNARGKTLASIYSPRVSKEAAVSFPISWDELDDVYPNDFTMHNVPELLRKQGDLWADILDHKSDMRGILANG